MWGRKIVYILLVIITSYIALMYESPVPGVFLAFELLLPIALFALTWYHKKNVKVTIGNGQQVADCEEKIEIPIRFHNNGWFPITDASVRVNVSNTLDGEKESYDINLRALAKTSVTVPFTFCSTYCGVIKISFERIVVFDYLRLFQRKKTISAQAECVVMPHLLDLQVAVTDACRNFDSDSEEYDKHNAGDDPAEIYQIREFRQGDKMSRVHWKMTARLDQMMIKELSRPISDSVGIFLDLRYQTIEEIQSVYDLCYSLSAALCFNECHHRMIWYSQDGGGAFEEHLIKGMDDITAVMSKLLVSAKRTDKLYWEEYKSSRSTPLYRMIAISCMDTNKDEQLGDFLSSDGTRKSILTINEIHELIEI